MTTWRDAEGRSWDMRITVGTIRRVKATCGVDLTDVMPREGQGETALERLAGDVVLLVDTIYCVVQPDAEKRGITDEQFAEGLRGDAIDDATTALIQGIAEFFPAKKKDLLLALVAKGEALQEAALAEVMAHLSGESSISTQV